MLKVVLIFFMLSLGSIVAAEDNPPESVSAQNTTSQMSAGIDNAPSKVQSSANPPSSNNSIDQADRVQSYDWAMVVVSFLGVIGFILALGWVAKRFSGLSTVGGRDMKVVSVMPLGTREKVAIIDVKGQQFLVGITPQNINHLHSFDTPVVKTDERGSGDFAGKLAQILKQKSVVKDEQI